MTTDLSVFVPVLTVMVDYGNAPFLWLAKRAGQAGIGGNVCDGTSYDEGCPMSEGLWREFADWACVFDRMDFDSDCCDASDWDWPTFHARGLQLACRLKREVGDAYRVVYDKPCEDPNHRLDERREIFADGTLQTLPMTRSTIHEPHRFCQHIVSGGQTGADRAALDFAIRHGYTHGGWVPRGREAEDGRIPAKYQLVELAEGGYRQRTRRNVQDSGGTLIVNVGALEGGTHATLQFARRLGKPCLVVQLDNGVAPEAIAGALAWLRAHAIQTLNIAGPREGRRPSIHRTTLALLEAMGTAMHET